MLLNTFDNWKVEPLILYSNTPVPPDAVTVTVEVNPEQTVGAAADASMEDGCEMTIGAVDMHPFASLIVTV